MKHHFQKLFDAWGSSKRFGGIGVLHTFLFAQRVRKAKKVEKHCSGDIT
jgi:hypothetical protein